MTKKKAIISKEAELQIIKQEMAKLDEELKIGDITINKDSNYRKVHDINAEKGICFVKYDYEKHKWKEHKYDKKYPFYGYTDWKYVESYKHIVINQNPEEHMKKTLQEIAVTDYDDEENNVEETNERALVAFNKDYVVAKKNELIKKQKKFEVLRRVLSQKRWEMQQFVSKFEKQIKKVMKVLYTIELYLGIEEDIFHLQSGQNAPIGTPISVRQQILYMDEEIAVYENQGLDHQDIAEFDNWLIENKNYEKLLPEKKGIVVIRVRRKDKDYGGNPIENFFANQPNRQTYLLIRNGDNLYRIFANIVIHPRMFPKKEELQKLLNEPEGHEASWDKEKREDVLYYYRQNLVLLQGLLDRAQILQPIKKMFNLFKVETYDETDIKFIYDDELTLPDGKMLYRDWREELNGKIKRGTRIYFSGFDFRTEREGRIPNYVYGSSPPAGIYSVKEIQEGSKWTNEKIICQWLPNDEVWNRYNSHPRKNKCSFNLRRYDNFVLNYDLITIEEIDYYIHNRYERRNYLDMLPVLKKLRRDRIEEMKWEKGFVDSLVAKLHCDPKIVWEIVVWWKAKVIWKRPILEDDAKALRMITSRLKKKLNGEL